MGCSFGGGIGGVKVGRWVYEVYLQEGVPLGALDFVYLRYRSVLEW